MAGDSRLIDGPCVSEIKIETNLELNISTFEGSLNVSLLQLATTNLHSIHATTMRVSHTSMLKPLLRPQTQPTCPANRAFYATPTKSRRVQTPVQSQPKEKVAPSPLEPEAGSQPIQTPVQSQRPSHVAPGSHPVSRAEITQTKPLLFLTFGLTGVAVFSYFYYQYRKEHMDRKWAAMQQEARQNVRNRS